MQHSSIRLSNSLHSCRYYFSAALVDNPMVGRLRIQIFGFLGVGALFMVSAGAYGPLTTKGGIGTFQFIYFFSSFVVSSHSPQLNLQGQQ